MASYLFDKLNYSGFKNIPGAVYTRSGVEYQQNAEGVWTPFDDDVPPISAGVGVDVWEARTNYVRNPTGLGGSAGVWPTSWSAFVGGAGLTWTPVGPVVLADGRTAFRARLTGTNSTGGQVYPTVNFDASATFPAVQGDKFVAEVEARIAAGGITGISNQAFGINEGLTPSGTVNNFSLATTVSSTLAKFRRAAWAANASTISIKDPKWVLTVDPGIAVDISYDFIWPQLKQGADINDPPILQTNNAAATRGNPSMYINAPGLLVPPFTVQVWAQLPAIDGVNRRLLDIDDGNGNNRVAMLRSNANNGSIAAWASGVQAANTDFTGKTGARLLKMAARVRPTSYRAACDGALGSEVSTSAMQQMSRIVFGNTLVGGTAYLNGSIQRFQIINRDISDTELVNLTV